MAIPSPLRSGSYTLSGASYTGDVGSTDAAHPAILNLQNGASAAVTVEGLGDPMSQSSRTHYATFHATGSNSLTMSAIGGGRSPYGPGYTTVNLDPGASLSGSFSTTMDGFLTVNGAGGGHLQNYSGTLGGGSANVHADLVGNGTVQVNAGSPGAGGQLTLDGVVANGETVALTAGNLLLNKPMQFSGAINWAANGSVSSTQAVLAGIKADSYKLAGGALHLFSTGHDFLDLRVQVGGSSPFHVAQTAQGVALTYMDPHWISGAVPLPVHS